MLACEGDQYPNTKPQTSRDALKAYADAGGRVYLSHWQNYWISAGPAPWSSLASWNFGLSNLDSFTADINSGFAQVGVLRSWLVTVGASTTPGTLSIFGGRQTAVSVDESLVRKWIYKDVTVNSAPTMQYFSFTTPVEFAFAL